MKKVQNYTPTMDIRLNAKRWVQRILRCYRAVFWSIRFLARYCYVRRQVAAHMGKKWVQQQLPTAGPRHILNSSVQTFRTAWNPPIQRNATRRTKRIQQILLRLDALNRPTYLITTKVGQRVYFAALLRCINAICQQRISAEALQAIHGPLSSSVPTSIAAYLRQWLSGCLARQPQMWSDPIPVSKLHTSSPSSGNANGAHPDLVARTPSENQIRHEHTVALDSAASTVADQELHSLMVEHELKFLALPTAILEACRRSKVK